MAHSRRAARELALKILYQADVGKMPIEEAFHSVTQGIQLDEKTIEFLKEVVYGTFSEKKAIDQRIADLSSGWALDRQAAVDRNILRLAAYEILFSPAIPYAASINEAVELAKKYSTQESGRFVNGVLGAMVNALKAENRSLSDNESQSSSGTGG